MKDDKKPFPPGKEGRIIVEFPCAPERVVKIKIIPGRRWHPEERISTGRSIQHKVKAGGKSIEFPQAGSLAPSGFRAFSVISVRNALRGRRNNRVVTAMEG